MLLYSPRMGPSRFRKTARTAAWLLLAWVAVDLGNPSLCALDQDVPVMPLSDAALDTFPPDSGAPDLPAHIDDCFCCSHCVNIASVQPSSRLAQAGLPAPLPTDAAAWPTAYPPYHPPRA
jgi:hypothetical protein